MAKGDTLHLIAATQGAPSLTVLSVDLSDLGVIGQGADGYGTAADDILTATPDVRDLHGGAGRDLFVFGPEDADSAGMLGQVLDFEPGIDRLDLSGVPLLSSAGQVGVIATDDGATLTFRGLTLEIVTADKTPLTPAALDDATLFDAMHPLFMPTQTVVDLSAFDATVFASPKGLPAGPGTPRDSFFTFLAKTEVPAGDTQTFADWAGTAPRIPEAAEIDQITPYFDLIL